MEFIRRIYSDYLMPGRWSEYRAFLSAAKANGYQFTRHQDAESALATAEGRLLFFLRHDIDTDVAIAKTMFSIERELGIYSTYYFRRCTADPGLMHEILSYGSEVGYHYEELSDHIKTTGIRSKERVLSEMETIRAAFLLNLKAFETTLGAKVHTVASHGDWINRHFSLQNVALMSEKLRTAAGIQLEAYDEPLASRISFRAADRLYIDLWHPSSPMTAIEEHSPVILVLVHPRQWQCAPLGRLRMDIERLLEGVRYYLS